MGIYLEYHPLVRTFQRGDVTALFAKHHHLATPLGTPYAITYPFEGKFHDYLPDYVGRLTNGHLFIAEAGMAEHKLEAQEVAKASAARRYATLKGGIFWIGTERHLSVKRHHNLIFLQARRMPFATYEAIRAALLAAWPMGETRSVAEWMQVLGPQWSEREVEGAVWKLVGDAAASGHLLVDLSAIILDRDTPLAFTDPASPPILPDSLPDFLEPHDDAPPPAEPVFGRSSLADGLTFDASTLPTETARRAFHRNLAAVLAVCAGRTLRQVAHEHGMSVATLSRLVKRAKDPEIGQLACVPYATYQRDTPLHPALQAKIRKLYGHPLRPTIQAITDDVNLTKLAREVGAPVPSYMQVYRLCQRLKADQDIAFARSGLKHPVHSQMSPEGFVRTLRFPGLVTQVDEHYVDALIVDEDGTVITRRVHIAVLIDVKTAAILALVMALDTLCEEDYMRLLKQAMEAKGQITTLYQCQHAWTCQAKPMIVFHDRGKIFTSERAISVLVDRFGITTEQAPPFCPTAKGTVEALFAWSTKRLEHRLPGTTKSSAAARGAYDSVREATKAGITLDVLEELFIQAIVDDYQCSFDTLRRGTRAELWEAAVARYGVPQYLGAPDDLKLLLMKAVNRKNPEQGQYAIHPGKGLSFEGRRYVNVGLLNRLRGRPLTIYYDRRDVSVIYLYCEGVYVGEAYCVEFAGRRVSWWEARSMRRRDARHKKTAEAEALVGRQRVQERAEAGKTANRRETRRLQQERQRQLQRGEIHPDAVLDTLHAMVEAQRPPAPPTVLPAASALLPPPVPHAVDQPVPLSRIRTRGGSSS
jgi:putative transposase